jgi:FkbM family methyltransferase
VRAARFTLNRARMDLPNEAPGNGEHALQRWVLASIPTPEPITVLDVGANIGEWSRAVLAQARRTGHVDQVRLHAFEPASYTHGRLLENLPDWVRVNRLAVSSEVGEATLHVVHPGAGTNSLHGCSTAHDAVHTELVSTTTVDEYLRQNDIRRVDLLKIDTEGHDFLVLTGAVKSFQDRAISLVQFEYNHRWVYARHFLKDVFDLLCPLGYQVGKLTPRGMELYPGWDHELETFIEGNYLACTDEMVQRLPRISWWK